MTFSRNITFLEIENINNIYLKHSILLDWNTVQEFINKHKSVTLFLRSLVANFVHMEFYISFKLLHLLLIKFSGTLAIKQDSVDIPERSHYIKKLK